MHSVSATRGWCPWTEAEEWFSSDRVWPARPRPLQGVQTRRRAERRREMLGGPRVHPAPAKVIPTMFSSESSLLTPLVAAHHSFNKSVLNVDHCGGRRANAGQNLRLWRQNLTGPQDDYTSDLTFYILTFYGSSVFYMD
ncbi:hypothetical protein J6590_039426 [Homalodisca vitripennis]|nr:hypothetical protein J6590_039426 [Homalodisca vitripennis]